MRDLQGDGRLRRIWGLFIAIVFLLTFQGTAIADPIDATWNGGTGFWNVAGNWDTTDYPHNNGSTYNVFIDGSKTGTYSNVTLNTSVAIENLTIDSGDILNQNNGISFSLNGNIANNGTMAMNSTGHQTNLIMTGGSDVTLA